MTSRPGPKFVGVDTAIDRLGRFRYRVPLDWHRFEIEGQEDSMLYSPSATDTRTYIASWVNKLEFQAEADDLGMLASALNEGLAQLPDLTIEHEANDSYQNLIKLDRTYTFRENGELRKRHAWFLYVADWQITFVYQGSSPEEYEYWLPMGNTAFYHFNVAEALWFATDRDLFKPGDTKERAPRGSRAS
jgi:hypothetical protein